MNEGRNYPSAFDGFHSMEKFPVNRGITILRGALVLIVLTAVLLAAAVRIPPETFDYSLYEDEIARFQSSMIVDPIGSSQDAIRAAIRLWHQEFGDTVDQWRPYKAYYDAEHDAWMVKRKPPEVPEGMIILYRNCYCFIEGSTGKVLALFLQKA